MTVEEVLAGIRTHLEELTETGQIVANFAVVGDLRSFGADGAEGDIGVWATEMPMYQVNGLLQAGIDVMLEQGGE